jgi:hypothetical protein
VEKSVIGKVRRIRRSRATESVAGLAFQPKLNINNKIMLQPLGEI